MTATRYNLFQRLARQWDALHPYNAGQVMKLEGVADMQRWIDAWAAACRATGLARVTCGDNGFTWHADGASRPAIVEGATLDEHVSRELDRRFESAEPPFRPFLLQRDGFYYAGVLYHHWVADSVAMRMILREWLALATGALRPTGKLLPVLDGGYLHMMLGGRASGRLFDGVLAVARLSSCLRRVRRVESGFFRDFSQRFALVEMPRGWIGRIYTAAGGLKLNDVFLAAMARMCDGYGPVSQRGGRQDLALGTIVDLRPDADPAIAAAFGMVLGFTTVIARPRDLADDQRLLKTIARQNMLQRRTGVAQSSVLRMLGLLAAGRLLRERALVSFYRKRVPLAAGISNVRFRNSWIEHCHPSPLLDYVRISPTGPMTPLVLATTTLGDSFHFGITYRSALINPASIPSIASTFTQAVESLVQAV